MSSTTPVSSSPSPVEPIAPAAVPASAATSTTSTVAQSAIASSSKAMSSEKKVGAHRQQAFSIRNLFSTSSGERLVSAYQDRNRLIHGSALKLVEDAKSLIGRVIEKLKKGSSDFSALENLLMSFLSPSQQLRRILQNPQKLQDLAKKIYPNEIYNKSKIEQCIGALLQKLGEDSPNFSATESQLLGLLNSPLEELNQILMNPQALQDLAEHVYHDEIYHQPKVQELGQTIYQAYKKMIPKERIRVRLQLFPNGDKEGLFLQQMRDFHAQACLGDVKTAADMAAFIDQFEAYVREALEMDLGKAEEISDALLQTAAYIEGGNSIMKEYLKDLESRVKNKTPFLQDAKAGIQQIQAKLDAFLGELQYKGVHVAELVSEKGNPLAEAALLSAQKLIVEGEAGSTELVREQWMLTLSKQIDGKATSFEDHFKRMEGLEKRLAHQLAHKQFALSAAIGMKMAMEVRPLRVARDIEKLANEGKKGYSNSNEDKFARNIQPYLESMGLFIERHSMPLVRNKIQKHLQKEREKHFATFIKTYDPKATKTHQQRHPFADTSSSDTRTDVSPSQPTSHLAPIPRLTNNGQNLCYLNAVMQLILSDEGLRNFVANHIQQSNDLPNKQQISAEFNSVCTNTTGTISLEGLRALLFDGKLQEDAAEALGKFIPIDNVKRTLDLDHAPSWFVFCPNRVKAVDAIRKDEAPVDAPNTKIINGENYQLCSIVCHEGVEATSGHYIAYILKDAQWYKANDGEIAPVASPRHEKTGYLYYYKRV